MRPGARQDLLNKRLRLHIPYLIDKIYRGPEIYSACKILLNAEMSCAMTIVWESIVSAGRKMATSLPEVAPLPGALGQQGGCLGRDTGGQRLLPAAVGAVSSHPGPTGEGQLGVSGDLVWWPGRGQWQRGWDAVGGRELGVPVVERGVSWWHVCSSNPSLPHGTRGEDIHRRMRAGMACWGTGFGHSHPHAGLVVLPGGGGAGSPGKKALLMETRNFRFWKKKEKINNNNKKNGVRERAWGLPWKPIAEPRRSRRHSHGVPGSAAAVLARARAHGAEPGRWASHRDMAERLTGPRWKKGKRLMDGGGSRGWGSAGSRHAALLSEQRPPAQRVNKSDGTAAASRAPQPRCRLAPSYISRKINRTNYSGRTMRESPENPNY